VTEAIHPRAFARRHRIGREDRVPRDRSDQRDPNQ
jgi:hypothetical protein